MHDLYFEYFQSTFAEYFLHHAFLIVSSSFLTSESVHEGDIMSKSRLLSQLWCNVQKMKVVLQIMSSSFFFFFFSLRHCLQLTACLRGSPACRAEASPENQPPHSLRSEGRPFWLRTIPSIWWLENKICVYSKHAGNSAERQAEDWGCTTRSDTSQRTHHKY